jgi:curved DNA-binding protein CbpA
MYRTYSPFYFASFKTRDEIKEEYRRLCRLHHPDLFATQGEDIQAAQTRIMQEINAEFAIAMDAAVRAEKPGQSEASYAGSADLAERIRQAIEAVIRFDGIEIEICGAWVWLHGETYPIKDALKEAGYRWGRQKRLWYFAGVSSSSRSSHSMDEIRDRYGSERVNRPSQPTHAQID